LFNWFLAGEVYLSSDRTLQQSIERRFLHDPHLSAFGLTVESLNGIVTLKGSVSNARAKLTAHELAQSTPGVRDVLNEIAVEPAGGISDQQITDEIRFLLDSHPAIGKGSIAVQVDVGIVTLGGAVGSPVEYALAEDVARSARGVRAVHNLLLIDRTAQDDDESLQLEIEAALAEVPDLRDSDIKVAVSGDLIVLSGQVRDVRLKQMAEDAALSVRPWRIRNEINILTPRSVPDV
jgi:osmotically-inducible protein OsmY